MTGAASSSMSCSARSWTRASMPISRRSVSRSKRSRKSLPQRRRRSRVASLCRPRSRAGKYAADPETTECNCGCRLERIGEDVSEKLDYTPGVFEVEQSTSAVEWVCRSCEHGCSRPRCRRDVHRQGDPDGGPAGAGADRQIPGSRAAAPRQEESILRTCRAGAAALNVGAVGGCLRRGSLRRSSKRCARCS